MPDREPADGATAPDFVTVVENRVRFAETDQQGIVFYGTFFTYQDEAVNALLRRIGHRYAAMESQGFTTHIVHAELDYRAPARFEDVVENELRIARLGSKSFTVDYRARRQDDGDLLAEGNVVHVTADVETGEAIPIPTALREALAGVHDDPPPGPA